MCRVGESHLPPTPGSSYRIAGLRLPNMPDTRGGILRSDLDNGFLTPAGTAAGKGIARKFKAGGLMMSPRKLTLLSVLLFCATWMVAQSAPGGGAAPGGSGTPGQASPSTPPTGNTGQPPTGSTAPPPTGSTTPGSSATPGSNPTNPNGSPSTPGSPSNPGAQPDGGTTNPDTSNPGSTPGSSNPGGSNPGSANPGGTPPGR